MKSNPPQGCHWGTGAHWDGCGGCITAVHGARGETATPLHQLTGEVAPTQAILHWGDRRQISIRVSCV